MHNKINKVKIKYRYTFILLKQLVKTDFKLRYQNSILGYLWSLLRPLALFTILYIVFVRFLRVGEAVPHYAVYLLVGIVLWNFFSEITIGNVGSIVGKGDLMRKLSFPRYVIVVASSISALINLCLNLFIVGIFLILNNVELTRNALLLLPLIIMLYIFSLSLAFFLSTLYVRLRDIGYVWEVIMQAAFYATPIIYPLSLVEQRSELAAKALMLNPIAQIIQDSRYVLVTDKTVTLTSLYGNRLITLLPVCLIAATFILSVVYFKSRSRYFAEEI